MGNARETVELEGIDVTAGKPDPEVFLAAARRLHVEPAACVVIEDSENGIAAGLAAGMRIIGVGPHAAAHGPTWAVDSVADIQAAVTTRL